MLKNKELLIEELLNSKTEPITNNLIKNSTKTVLNNQADNKFLGEASSYFAGSMGTASNYTAGTDGVSWDHIGLGLVSRMFPNLLAHKCVSVQPLNGPNGYVYYARNYATQAYTDTTKASPVSYAAGTAEVGYNMVDKNYTLSSSTSASEQLGEVGGGTFPEIQIKVSKQSTEALNRKLRTSFSLELLQDMKYMHNTDLQAYMTELLVYEIAAEKDRELIDTMISVATSGGWNYTTASGQWENEKLRTMYNRIVTDSNQIAVNTRLGAGNFIIASPAACAALEQLAVFNAAPVPGTTMDTRDIGSTTLVGALSSRFMVYMDTFAPHDYYLVGYLGNHPFKSGIIYAPYIELELFSAVSETTFKPAIGVQSRYALISNVFGAGNFYKYRRLLNMPS